MIQDAYIRGDGQAAAYLGFKDVRQGRTFRVWAETAKLPFAVIGNRNTRIYRRADIDRAWAKQAENLHAPQN